MSFTSTDPVSQKGQTNTWLTPLSLIEELGTFDLDPCGLKSHKTANLIIELPQDGLALDWVGRVWMNPPYGKEQQEWLERMLKHGSGIALIFNRLETKWIQPFLINGFFQIEGRLSFMREDKTYSHNAGVGSILIPFSRYDLGMILKSNLKGRYFK